MSPRTVASPAGPTLEVAVQGIGLWAPGLGQWAHARAAWRGEAPWAQPDALPASPVASLLPPAERRRAPQTVSLALDVAEQACTQSGLPPSAMRSVFCSSLGDMAITDYLCATLAESPDLLSPLKFHHSVHNAASGYWTIGVGNVQASCAMAAGAHSFAQALLEAATQAVCEASAVLLVAYDMASPGPLKAITGSQAPLALALVLVPPSLRPAGSPATPTLRLSLQAPHLAAQAQDVAEVPACVHPTAMLSLMAHNPMGLALPLLARLACADGPEQGRAEGAQVVRFKLSSTLDMRVAVVMSEAQQG